MMMMMMMTTKIAMIDFSSKNLSQHIAMASDIYICQAKHLGIATRYGLDGPGIEPR